MKGYKGFKKDFTCKDKQYEENTIFEEERAEICECGMHYCESPLDVLDYYSFVDNDGQINEFAEVEALDEPKTDNGQKFCTKKLKIGAKLGLSGFVKACVDFVIEKTTIEMPDIDKDDKSVIGSSGDSAQIGSSGYSARIGSSGNSAQIESTGEDTVICCAGYDSTVKAKKGNWITLAEWEYSEKKERYVPKCVKTEFVDGERIKENVTYKLVAGEFKEVERRKRK